jgi:hypothetical protein
VNVVLDQLISSSKELSGKDDNGGSSVSNFSVLDLGKLDQDFGGWMGDLELLEDCGAIVGNGNITNVVNQHLIETLWTEGGLHNV